MTTDEKIQNINKDFMLKEFDRINELWITESSQSETRVNYFLTAASAGIGILGVILSFAPSRETYSVALFVLIVLLLFGIVTLNRINSRNVQIIAFHETLNDIYEYFSKNSPEIHDYLLKQQKRYNQKPKTRSDDFFHEYFSGTLSDFVRIINALICSGISFTVLLIYGSSINLIIICGVIIFSIAFVFQRKFFRYMRNKLRAWKYY